MADALEDVLRLVAEGRLSPDEAAPIIEALGTARRTAESAPRAARETAEGYRSAGRSPGAASGAPRRLRIRVRDGGRTAVDLQLPGVIAELAGAIPGIPADYAERVREALRVGATGSIVDVNDEDGSGVSITIE